MPGPNFSAPPTRPPLLHPPAPSAQPSLHNPGSRAALVQALNAQGYGKPGTGLKLDLVYNPNGAFLAPAQVRRSPKSQPRPLAVLPCTGARA